MKLGPHGKYLVEFVTAYAQDEMQRFDFDLDYSGYIIEHFSGFQTETSRLADKFARTIDRTYESDAWMGDDAFALAMSDALDEFLGISKLPDFY